ncbi:MAG TPA: uroporphyrinogen decarboxylase family protein [Candidatus Bathyarchaeia archaeon]|nr:uroporphyrinogen decarboxylase family protein [Candidatus Bathyarchaeia archaeon]
MIEIGVSVDELEARRERVERTRRFERPDRVPVIPAIGTRYLVPQVGVRFRDYFRDPEAMLRTQLLAQKWLHENVRTDAYAITGPWVGVWTDFENAFESGSLGVDVVFPDDDIPWVGRGWVKDEADLRRLEAMDFVHDGLNARQIAFRKAMMAVAGKYPVRFRGGPVFYPAENPALTHTSDGPFGVAGDLMGQTEIFLAVKERSDFVRELLRIVTDKLIAWLDFCWEEERLPRPKDFAWTDDLAVSLSAEDFRAVVLPSEKRLRFHFDGRASLHMCGRSDHLLGIFRDDLAIHEFQGFGYEVDLDRVAAVMGGRVVLLGNVDPMLIRNGTPAAVRAATRRVLDTLGPLGGLIIQDGNNIPPDSPVANINAMTEAAEEWGRP